EPVAVHPSERRSGPTDRRHEAQRPEGEGTTECDAKEPPSARAMLRKGEHQPRHDDGDRDENVRHRAAEARENQQERPVPWHGRTDRRRPGIPDEDGETRESDGHCSREGATASPHANPPFDALVRLSKRYPAVASKPVTAARS